MKLKGSLSNNIWSFYHVIEWDMAAAKVKDLAWIFKKHTDQESD